MAGTNLCSCSAPTFKQTLATFTTVPLSLNAADFHFIKGGMKNKPLIVFYGKIKLRLNLTVLYYRTFSHNRSESGDSRIRNTPISYVIIHSAL